MSPNPQDKYVIRRLGPYGFQYWTERGVWTNDRKRAVWSGSLRFMMDLWESMGNKNKGRVVNFDTGMEVGRHETA